MTSKQMAEAARQLDHLGMTALWEENKRLRAALEHALEAAEETDPGCEECKEARKLLRSLR